MFARTTEKLKAGYQDAVAMPVKQNMFVSVLAVIIALIALVVAGRR